MIIKLVLLIIILITKSIDTSSNNNQSINNTHEENIPKPLKTLKKTGEKYFTNNSNLVTKIEELV